MKKVFFIGLVLLTILTSCATILSGTKANVMESFKQILDVDNIRTVLNECERCGEPTSAKICKACEIKDIVNENKKK